MVTKETRELGEGCDNEEVTREGNFVVIEQSCILILVALIQIYIRVKMSQNYA